MTPEQPSGALRFGMLGCARITPAALVYPAESMNEVVLACVGARDPVRARAFAAEHRIERVAEDYRAVVEDPEVDAVYIPLPITLHRPWALAALAAGKHVLCEKALTCNAAEARQLAEAATRADRVLMEAFHYRYHPLFERVRTLLGQGAIGTLRRIEGRFCVPHIPEGDIRMDFATGGGALMDLGCYPVHWLRHATGREPVVRAARARTGPEQVDMVLDGALVFPAREAGEATIEGAIHCSMDPGDELEARLTLEGDGGMLTVINPLAPQAGHELRLDNAQGELREQIDRTPSYRYQLEAFVAAVRGAPTNLTDGEDAVRNMTLIDALYEAAGLRLRGT
ncbi:MAG: Gfo/Idh/MocA family oxidoreductase [Pseudomonadales bacterium]|nr:Gfo/Idh/MocA family oxidoreductase [Pseudomonadales bacterium]